MAIVATAADALSGRDPLHDQLLVDIVFALLVGWLVVWLITRQRRFKRLSVVVVAGFVVVALGSVTVEWMLSSSAWIAGRSPGLVDVFDAFRTGRVPAGGSRDWRLPAGTTKVTLTGLARARTDVWGWDWFRLPTGVVLSGKQTSHGVTSVLSFAKSGTPSSTVGTQLARRREERRLSCHLIFGSLAERGPRRVALVCTLFGDLVTRSLAFGSRQRTDGRHTRFSYTLPKDGDWTIHQRGTEQHEWR